jgi:GNAT superfamily N-acetyltransferase
VGEVEGMLSYVAMDGDEPIGIISVNIHNEWTAEVHVLAICEPYHGKGIGTRLLAEAEEKLRELKIEFLTVKTLSPSKKCRVRENSKISFRKRIPRNRRIQDALGRRKFVSADGEEPTK